MNDKYFSRDNLEMVIDGLKLGIKENLDSVIDDLKSKDVIPDWNQNNPDAFDYIKNRTHYEIPAIWTKVILINDSWSNRATCKLVSTPIEWTEDNFYKIRIDGIEYTFEGMKKKSGGNAVVYYIGAEWLALNSNMDFSEHSFCFVTTDFTDIYAVFEDDTINHTIEFCESETEIHQIDEKYIPDTIVRAEMAESFAQFVDENYQSKGDYVTEEVAEAILDDYVRKDELLDFCGNVDLGVTGATIGQAVKISAVDENGKPTEWECVDMPDSGGNTIQADWNQTDESAVDYIKNRTHWIEQSVSPILAERNVSNEESITELKNTNAPDSCIITLDNVRYQCNMWINDAGEYCFGDSRIRTVYDSDVEAEVTDTSHPEDAPFYISVCGEDDIVAMETTYDWYVTLNSDIASTVHTISIGVVSGETVHKLDSKYLPKAEAVSDAVGSTVTQEEFNALLNALRNAGYLEI